MGRFANVRLQDALCGRIAWAPSRKMPAKVNPHRDRDLTEGGRMKIGAGRKMPKMDEHESNLREAAIRCINQKLRRMEIGQLSKIIRIATEIIESNKTD